MPAPKQLPVRVLVKGPSTLLWTSMMGGPRSDLVFPRAVEAELLAKGRACEVLNGGVLGWMTGQLFDTWDAEVCAWQPDVLILAACHFETVHAILPRWLERRANTEHRRPGFRNVKRLFFRGLARGIILLQRRIDGPWLTRSRRARRALADTQAYIDMTSRIGSPLIILLEVHEPTLARQAWFPGWVNRIRLVNQDLRDLAEKNADKNTRFVEVSDLMGNFDPGTAEQLWADGIHFSPPFHRALGAKLADIVEEWARHQPHLEQP